MIASGSGSSQQHRQRSYALFNAFASRLRHLGGTEGWLSFTTLSVDVGIPVTRVSQLPLRDQTLFHSNDDDIPVMQFYNYRNRWHFTVGDSHWTESIDFVVPSTDVIEPRILERCRAAFQYVSTSSDPSFGPSVHVSAAVQQAIDPRSGVVFSSWFGGNLLDWPIVMVTDTVAFSEWTLSWLYCALISEALHMDSGRFPYVNARFFEFLGGIGETLWLDCVQNFRDVLQAAPETFDRHPRDLHWETDVQEMVVERVYEYNAESLRLVETKVSSRLNVAFLAQPQPPRRRLRLTVTTPPIAAPSASVDASVHSHLASLAVDVQMRADEATTDHAQVFPQHQPQQPSDTEGPRRSERNRRSTEAMANYIQAAEITAARQEAERLVREQRAEIQRRAEERDAQQQEIAALLEHRPKKDPEIDDIDAIDKGFENTAAVKGFHRRFSAFVNGGLQLVTCGSCSETWVRDTRVDVGGSPRSEEPCIDCKHDKSRQKRFGEQQRSRVLPTIFQHQVEWSKQFWDGVVSDETTADAQQRAHDIFSPLPRYTLDPRFDLFQVATVAELSIIAPIRLFAYIYRRGGGYAGTRGTAIAFPGINPALPIVMSIPHSVSPFIILLQRSADGALPPPRHRGVEGQKVRRSAVIAMVDYLITAGNFANGVVDAIAMNNLPLDGTLPNLVTINIAHGTRVTNSQASDLASQSVNRASGSSSGVVNVTAADVDLGNRRSNDNVDAQDGDENVDGAPALVGVDFVEHNFVDAEAVDGGHRGESDDEEKADDSDDGVNEYESENHPPEGMGHAESLSMTALVPREIEGEAFEDALLARLAEALPRRSGTPVIDHPVSHRPAPAPLSLPSLPSPVLAEPRVIDVPHQRFHTPIGLTNPAFFPGAFPDLFANTIGVPQYWKNGIVEQGMYPLLEHTIAPEAQIAHLLKLGYKRGDGQMCYPFQRSISFLVVARQITERARVGRQCSWIIKDYDNLSVDELVEMSKTAAGMETITNLISRSNIATIGSPKYLKDKHRVAKEILFQLPPANLFVTLSFADIHHPAVLRLLGLTPDAPYDVRRETVANAPGLATAAFTAMKEEFIHEFLERILGVTYIVDRDEFQARNAIHSHMVMHSVHLDYSQSVSATCEGRAARHILFKRDIEDDGTGNVNWKKREDGFEGNDLYTHLLELSDAELVQIAQQGDWHERIMCRAQEILVSAMHSAIERGANETTAAETLKQFVHGVKARVEAEAPGFDVVSFVLAHDPNNEELFAEQPLAFNDRVDYMSSRVMIHDCRPDYCYQTKSQKREKRCRFGLRPMASFCAVTLEFKAKKTNNAAAGSDDIWSVAPAVTLSIKRNHPDIVGFNRAMLAIWGANCDLKIIFDSEKVIQYILKYTLKKDVAASEVESIMKMSRGDGDDVVCSAQGRRIAERLQKGQFRNVAQFISSLVNMSSAMREIGAPELCMVLLSEPIVHFRNVKLTYIPATLDSGRLDMSGDGSGDHDGGVTLQKNCWEKYNLRNQICNDVAQVVLFDWDRQALAAMSPSVFFGTFYVGKNGIVRAHVDDNRVTIWPYYSDHHEMNPGSPGYFKWAKWYLLRFVAFEIPSLEPEGSAKVTEYLQGYFLPRAYELDPTLQGRVADSLASYSGPFSNEKSEVVQRLIVEVFKVFVAHDPVAKLVYESKIVKYQTVKRVRQEVRNGTVVENQGGIHSTVDRGSGADEPMVAGLAPNDPNADGVDDLLPLGLIARKKSQLLPPNLQRLCPDTLNAIAAAALTFVSTAAPSNRLNAPLPTRPLSQEQQKAFDLATHDVHLGGALFVHGGPGTGKSNFIRHLMNDNRVATITSATTAKASVMINGDTVHGIFALHSAHENMKDEKKRAIVDRLSGVTTIVVDEVSMLGTDLVGKLNSVLRKVAPIDAAKPWGGYRMIFCGDFAQCPPVKSGSPFHTHTYFNDCEVVLLTQSHRTTDPVSIELLRKMRNREMTTADAGQIRQMCCAQHNQPRAAAYATDWTVFELVTTNQEVDDINDRHIKQFATIENKLIGRASPKKGKDLLFCEGVRLCILKNVRKDYAITNGAFAICKGAIYEENRVDSLAIGENPWSIFIKPEAVGDVDVDMGWQNRVDGILRQGTSRIKDENGVLRPLSEAEIVHIVESMRGVIPMSQVESFTDDDGSGTQKWSSTFPLRLARGVTIHKLQGDSLDKLIMTPGNRKMFGTTFTGFSRARGGFGNILLAGNYGNSALVDDVNADPPERFDIIAISARLEIMAQATDERATIGRLYGAQPPQPVVAAAPAPLSSTVQVTFPVSSRPASSHPVQHGTQPQGRGRGQTRGRGNAQTRNRGGGAPNQARGRAAQAQLQQQNEGRITRSQTSGRARARTT